MFNYLPVSESTKKKILFLLLFSMVELACSVSGSYHLGGIISLVLLYATVFWDKHLPVCVYIITSILGTALTGTASTVNALFISVLSLQCIYRCFDNPDYRKYVFITLYFFVILVISYYTGFNSHIEYLVKMVVASLIVLQIASFGAQERSLVVASVLCSGIAMALLVLASIYSGAVIHDTSTRLQFNENSKVLSTAVAPVVFSAVYLMFFGGGKKKALYAIGLFFVAAALSYMLVLTYSRGVLIALTISVFYLLLRYMGGMGIKSILFLALFIVGAYYLLSIMQFDDELMFRHLEGGNGRTEIWADFIKQLKQTHTMAFGFGPGFTRDISRLDYYSHSTILDYLFCYGIAGFIYILYMLLTVAFKLFRTNRGSFYYQGLFLLSTIMFSTHGSAGTLLFNVILGLGISVVVYDGNEVG